MKYEPTDVEYEAKKSDAPYWADRTCVHCGNPYGWHWNKADGKIYCVREVEGKDDGAEREQGIGSWT